MIKRETVGILIFMLFFLALAIGGGSYMWLKLRQVDPQTRAMEHFHQAQEQVRMHNNAMAVDEYNSALDINPDMQDAYLGRGRALMSMGDTYGAIRDFSAVLSITPDLVGALQLRAEANEMVEQYEDAIADFFRVAEIDPRHRSALGNSGRLLLKLGQYEQSAEHLKGAIERVPSHSTAHRNLGWAMWGLGRYEEALKHFDRSIEEDPYNMHGFFGKGATYYHLQQLEDALPLLIKATESDQQRTDYPHFYLYLIRMRLGDNEAAIKSLNKQRTRRRPRTRDADWPRVVLEFLLGDLTEDDFFERVAETGVVPDPEKQVEAYFYIGAIRQINGDEEGAIEMFRKCVETNVYQFYEYNAAQAELRYRGLINESETPANDDPSLP